MGVNLKIFDLLVKAPHAQDLEQLASTTGADPVLLGKSIDIRLYKHRPLVANYLVGRILRHLASAGMIKEVAKCTFSANNITRTLASEGYQSGIYH